MDQFAWSSTPEPVTRRPLALAAPLGLALLAAALLAAAFPGRAAAYTTKRLDFESGNLKQWNYIQALPGRISIVRSPRRQGQFAAQFVVKHGDHPVGGEGERAELVSLTNERPGVDSWWRWSTFFPWNFNPVHGTWNIFTQWHQISNACPPPIVFAVDTTHSPGRILLKTRGGRLNLSTCAPGSKRMFTVAKFRRGQWYKFVLHIHWSPWRGAGHIRLWVNGTTRVRRHVATLYKGQGVYLKQGFYRAPYSHTSVLYQDGLQRFTR
jgi:hypothetical protein